MRLASPWTPHLMPISAPPSERLVAALAHDILEGKLESGDRLPPHRDLADTLAIGVGTVTKAFAMLERRGLVRSVKGRGTFVALVQTRKGVQIDLSRNAPPAVMTERLLARTLAAVARNIDSGLFSDYPPIAGHEEHRRLVARWFAGVGMEADPRHLVLTCGAHHAVALATNACLGRHGTLLTEAHTYPGMITLARHHALPLVGVAMDEQGMAPDALEHALGRAAAGPRALYVTPTMQNPTTATMSLARREAIVALCRAHDVWIIEDDVYSQSAVPGLPPLAMLAPERTFYANSLSKTLNPTLRIGGLVPPPSMYARVIDALHTSAIMVSPLSCSFMAQWMLDGTADAVRQAIRAESVSRVNLARRLLPGLAPQDAAGYHVWLPMPALEAQRIAAAAQAIGVTVTPPASTAADNNATGSGLRLCLGTPGMAELGAALAAIDRLRRQSS